MSIQETVGKLQSLSQSYFRTKEANRMVALCVKNEFDKVWASEVEDVLLKDFNFEEPKIEEVKKSNSTYYETVATSLLRKMRIDIKEFEEDLNNLKDNGFKILCFLIHCSNNY